jgi:hypothetical protein
MPQQTVEERSAARKAKLAALRQPKRTVWDSIKDAASGFGEEAENIYDRVRDTGRNAKDQILAGDFPGAFHTIAQPITQPFEGLQDFAVNGLPKLDRTQSAVGGAEMVGIPGEHIKEDVTKGNYAKAAGRGMFAAATMAGGYGASKMFKGLKLPQKTDSVMPDVPSPVREPSVLTMDVDPTPPSPPRYMEGRYGVNKTDWAAKNPLLAPVPDRLRPASPTESYFDSMLPSRTKELVSKPIDEFTQMGKEPGRLPPVQDLGAPVAKSAPVKASTLPAGTQSKLRRIGLTEDQIGGMNIEQANSFLKENAPPKSAGAAPKKSRIQQQPELANNKMVQETIKQAKADRPFSESRDEDLQYLSKMGVKGAQRELEIRAKAKGGFHINEDMSTPDVDPTQPVRPSIGDRVKDETGSVNLKDIFDAAGEAKDKLAGLFKVADKPDNPFMANYRDWVNNRKATTIEGIIKKKEFKDLDSKGLDGIFEFQSGARDGKFADVAKYFDDKFSQLNSAGVKVGFKENYLPQLWENPKADVIDMQRRLGLKPKFTLPSVLENYQVGIALGLKPKFKNVSELVGWYEKTANKSLADRQFFDWLKDNQLIQPKGRAAPNWKTLDPDHFPINKFKGVKKEYTGVLQAPPEIASVINNYLRDPAEVGGGVLQAIADGASLSKNFVLSAGIPLTGINAHGANILARNMMARGVLKGGVEAAKYLVMPKKAGNWIDENLASAASAVKEGLTLTTEDHTMDGSSTDLLRNNRVGQAIAGTKAGNAVEKLLATHGKLFEDPLFKNVIPALKLKHFNQVKAELLAKGTPPEQAGQIASHTTNAMYGGINWEAMARSRDLQNLLRATILAPDWFETNLRIGKGMGKALLDRKNPQGNAYAKAAANLLGAYIAANVVNYATTEDHHLMAQNAPGHTLDIQLGKSGDKVRYIRPFGTAADFFRLPYDTIAAMTGKNPDIGQGLAILGNRMSVPLHVGAHLATRTDHYGRPLTGKDAYGNPISAGKQVGNVLGEVSELVTPSYVSNTIGRATGRLNTEQAVLGGLEMPVRYAKPPQKGKRQRSRLPRVR